MASWDPTMPNDFTDGQVVDELDLDPMVNNINWLRYATVFQAGQRRTTDFAGITTTETAVLVTPATTLEAGCLYKIEGVIKWHSNTANDLVRIQVRQGTLAGAVLLSYITPRTPLVNAGNSSNFGIYLKNTVQTAGVTFTIGFNRHDGSGTLNCNSTSWCSVLRSGDVSLMTDV